MCSVPLLLKWRLKLTDMTRLQKSKHRSTQAHRCVNVCRHKTVRSNPIRDSFSVCLLGVQEQLGELLEDVQNFPYSFVGSYEFFK